jgi:hypothetical protein
MTRYIVIFALAGRFGYFYPGANTAVEFENGMIATYHKYVVIVGGFTGLVDGPSFFQMFWTGPQQSYHFFRPREGSSLAYSTSHQFNASTRGIRTYT